MLSYYSSSLSAIISLFGDCQIQQKENLLALGFAWFVYDVFHLAPRSVCSCPRSTVFFNLGGYFEAKALDPNASILRT